MNPRAGELAALNGMVRREAGGGQDALLLRGRRSMEELPRVAEGDRRAGVEEEVLVSARPEAARAEDLDGGEGRVTEPHVGIPVERHAGIGEPPLELVQQGRLGGDAARRD